MFASKGTRLRGLAVTAAVVALVAGACGGTTTPTTGPTTAPATAAPARLGRAERRHRLLGPARHDRVRDLG